MSDDKGGPQAKATAEEPVLPSWTVETTFHSKSLGEDIPATITVFAADEASAIEAARELQPKGATIVKVGLT